MADKEQDLIKLKCMNLKTKSCEGFKGKQPQGTTSRNFQANTETDLAYIIEKLEKLTTSINETNVNQTVFVRARPGLGYSSDNESSPSSYAQDKLKK